MGRKGMRKAPAEDRVRAKEGLGQAVRWGVSGWVRRTGQKGRGPRHECKGSSHLLLAEAQCHPTPNSVLQTGITCVKMLLSTHIRSQQKHLLGGSLELTSLSRSWKAMSAEYIELSASH